MLSIDDYFIIIFEKTHICLRCMHTLNSPLDNFVSLLDQPAFVALLNVLSLNAAYNFIIDVNPQLPLRSISTPFDSYLIFLNIKLIPFVIKLTVLVLEIGTSIPAFFNFTLPSRYIELLHGRMYES